jgi:cytochrome P450
LRLLHGRAGQVVFSRFGRQRYAYLLGREANAFVFSHDHLFRWWEAFQALVPVDGPTALIVSDGEDHVRRRAAVRPIMHHRQVASYVETMAATADEALAPVRAGVPFDAWALFRGAIRRSTLRTLFGERIAADTERIGALLQPLLDLVDLLPDVVDWHRRLRTPLWRRAMTARAGVDAYVDEQIALARRRPLTGESPALDLLVGGRDGTGSGLSDAEVRDQMVSLIAAGYETTSAAMAWAIYGLACRPDVMHDARAEILDVVGQRRPEATDLPLLPLTGAVITEALRLYPPATISARYVAVPFSFAGRPIPAGTLLLYSPYVTHRDPEVYEEPRRFAPERWLNGTKRPLEEYLPFGGGAHRCIGSPMAVTELTVMLARLLVRGTYEVKPGRVRARSMAALRPRQGMVIRLQ